MKQLNVQELRQAARVYARKTLLTGNGLDSDEMIDAVIDAAVKAAIVELIEHYHVDVPSLPPGVFGEIVKKEDK